jgi:hypothetical protein
LTNGTNGVLRSFDFDSATQLPRTNGAGGSECWGCDFGIMANSNVPNVPTIDTTVKASGTGSMKFTIPAGATSGSAGSWFTHFGPGKTGQISTGERIFVQYRVRWGPELLVNSNWPNSGGAKVMDISLGDLPSCNSSNPDSVNCPTSCPNQGFEFVLQNNQKYGIPTVYSNCNGTASFVMLAANTTVPSADVNPQNMVSACTNANPVATCRPFVANEWMTFKVMLQVGAWNAWANPVKVWFGREGQPLTLIVDCESAQSVKCTRDFSQAANGWWFENSAPASYKMGKVYLHPYQTGLTGGLVASAVWYDELIISTQDIADPGGAAPLAPAAPCCLSLTELTPASLALLAATFLGRRWYQQRRRKTHPPQPDGAPASPRRTLRGRMRLS